jgi:hypothetical protein
MARVVPGDTVRRMHPAYLRNARHRLQERPDPIRTVLLDRVRANPKARRPPIGAADLGNVDHHHASSDQAHGRHLVRRHPTASRPGAGHCRSPNVDLCIRQTSKASIACGTTGAARDDRLRRRSHPAPGTYRPDVQPTPDRRERSARLSLHMRFRRVCPLVLNAEKRECNSSFCHCCANLDRKRIPVAPPFQDRADDKGRLSLRQMRQFVSIRSHPARPDSIIDRRAFHRAGTS